MNTLSIIIVNWNTRDILLDCLDTIVAYPPQRPYDIWVVDNASRDGSVAAVQSRHPYAHIIANAENRGFAAANNQAIDASCGDYVLLLNSDTLVRAQALERMAHFLDIHTRVGVVGACLLNADGTLQPSWAAFPSFWAELLGRNVRARRPYGTVDGSTAYAVDWVGGAALMIRREVIAKIGALDEGYFMYSEETDWCFRVRKAGWDVCYLPHATIVHLGGQSSQKASARMKAELYRSKIRFYTKHYGRHQAYALSLALRAALYGKTLIKRVRGRAEADCDLHLLAQALNVPRWH
ncbi:glycosyltransferase family 2 protein [Roseiflexus sp.]|uniref:glycosyltransferase family 2 protein n=1 Tax=Roseiflexus sp. TaxID=2562120 RepID=UPI0021DEF9CD|nr:glycosyltransferase family 2 protein [Roseiflexus sp.]GIV99275.1 MAG: glycosyl transferase [Roseiflexus sp.]